MRKSNVTLLFFFVLLFNVSFAQGAQKVALVIGNSSYAFSPLANPVHDAEDMSKVLNDLGFSVITLKDADKRQMLNGLYDFAEKLKKSEIGLFFYAGHGMQIKGQNFLIPVGVNVRSETDVEYESLPAGRILGKMEEAGNRLNIVILDACRNNPFRSYFRSTGQGLAQMEAPVGSIIAYSTAPGKVAADGAGRNGLYTKYLLQVLKKKNLDVRQMLDQAGLGVMRETNRQQVPWTHSSPMEPIYLAGGNPTIVTDAVPDYGVGQQKGVLKVTSTPSGAAIRINGKTAGETPVELGNMTPGEVNISVSKSGYIAQSRVVEIYAGRRKVVGFDLVAEKKTGWLTVRPSPKSATVRIINIVPKYRPGMELEAGNYQVEVSAEGYITEKKTITLVAGDDISIAINLEQVKRLSTPSVTSTVTPAHPSSGGSTYTDPVTGMEFVYVQGGCYQMGDTFGDGGSDEKPVHEVCVDDFYIGKYEVTQGEYKKIMGSNPSSFQKGDRYPVETVSWNHAQTFIRKLNYRSGKTFKLPTEAEWEYAARSGGKKRNIPGQILRIVLPGMEVTVINQPIGLGQNSPMGWEYMI